MIISEVFKSVQGEGPNTGLPSIFIRTQGCPVKCSYCDTPYTHNGKEKGSNMEVKDIMKEIAKFKPVKHVVITGGEPTIQKDFVKLLDALIRSDYTVEIETAGVIDLWKNITVEMSEGTHILANSDIKWNISPKLASAEPKILPSPALLARYYAMCDRGTFKFVIKNEKDWIETTALINKIKKRLVKNGFGINKSFYSHILFMPEGRTTKEINESSKFIVSKITKIYPYTLCRLTPRLHVYVYGKKRGV